MSEVYFGDVYSPVHTAVDYISSCGIPLMPVVYQVVGFGRGNGRHSDRQRRSVV